MTLVIVIAVKPAILQNHDEVCHFTTRLSSIGDW